MKKDEAIHTATVRDTGTCEMCKHNILLTDFRVCTKRKLIHNPRIKKSGTCKEYFYRFGDNNPKIKEKAAKDSD